MDAISETSLQVTLSREELAYLVQLAGATKILGLGGTADAILYPEKTNSVYAAVERSLIARGLLSVQEDRSLTANPLLLDLIRLCIKPAYAVTVVLTDSHTGYASYRVYHVLPDVVVIHRQLLLAVHELQAVTDRPFDLAATVAALLPDDAQIVHQVQIQIASLLQNPPAVQEYSISVTNGSYWCREQLPANDAPAQAERQVTREELITAFEAIGAPIRALSQLQIEPQL